MSNELDGTYQVTTLSSDKTARKSDGRSEIKNGQTLRTDENRCLWTSSFTIINPNEVKMVSIADPSESPIDFYLLTPNGIPTRHPLQYESTLRLARKGDMIQMSGQIEHAGETVFLTMRSIKT